MTQFSQGAFALCLLAASAGTAAAQQSVEDFYKSKRTINLYIGYSPGGSYDLYARVVARHLGKYIPGKPNIVANNMPGAGSLRAANYIYSVAPKDGTALGALGETLAAEQGLKNPGVKYDATKLTWIGRIASSNNIFLVWNTSKAQSIQDAMTTEMTFAGTGPANLAETVPRVLKALTGAKLKVVSGYASSGPGMLAMERGEVDAAGTSWAGVKAGKMNWLKEKKAKIFLQALPARDPELPDVPALLEFAKTEADKQLLNVYASGGAIGRSYCAPPGVPAHIATALRDAFQAMAKDPDLKAEVAKARLDIAPADHEFLLKTVSTAAEVPESVRARVRQIFAK